MANKMSQYKLILSEIEHTLNKVDEQKNIKFLDEILKANAIFVAAKGRSSFVANSFAMRLNQLGKRSYVVGETTTPSIQEDDLLLIVSGLLKALRQLYGALTACGPFGIGDIRSG